MLKPLRVNEFTHKIKWLMDIRPVLVKPPEPTHIVMQVFGGDPVVTLYPALEALVIVVHPLDMEGGRLHTLTGTGVEDLMRQVMLGTQRFKGQMTIGTGNDIGPQSGHQAALDIVQCETVEHKIGFAVTAVTRHQNRNPLGLFSVTWSSQNGHPS
jgi:hypothetical protein